MKSVVGLVMAGILGGLAYRAFGWWGVAVALPLAALLGYATKPQP